MVNCCLVGQSSSGMNSVLRSFVKSINESYFNGDSILSIIKTDFSGNSTTLFHPNRVVFKACYNGRCHTLFGPFGDLIDGAVRGALITITRIATQLIAYFSYGEDIQSQFEYFKNNSLLRGFPLLPLLDIFYTCLP